MKKFVTSFFLFLIAFCALAQTKTAVRSGNWNDKDTWSPAAVPVSGDRVIIPEDIVVSIKGDIYKTSAPDLEISVSGRINFEPSGVLNLGVNSTIQLVSSSSMITSSGTSSELIKINNVTKYNGRADGATLTGPAYASATTGSSSEGGGFSPVPLPITLTHFAAKASNGTVVLTWKTAMEEGASHFEIERSADAMRWERLVSLPVRGANTTYSYTDALPLGTTGFYRLKLVDLDETFAYSPVAKVVGHVAASLQVGPNPATNFLNVSLSQSGSRLLQLQVLAAGGQLVKQLSAAPAGYTRLTLDGFPRGQYYLVVKDGAQVVESRAFVVR